MKDMSSQSEPVAVLNETNDQINASASQDVKDLGMNDETGVLEKGKLTPTLNSKEDITHENKRSSTQNNITNSLVTPSADTVEGEVTPPLPNGEKRLHPLFDEDKIASVAAARQEEASKASDDGADVKFADPENGRPNALRLLDSLGNEAGYPSPSGGFVPPIIDDNWALQHPPEPRSAHPLSSTTEHAENMKAARLPRPTSLTSSNIKTLSDQLLSGSSSKEKVTSGQEASSSMSSTENDQSAGRKVSSSHSSASGSFEMGLNAAHSQAISARSSPSTLAPIRRRSSGSAELLNMSTLTPNEDSGSHLPPLKIRDFAYEEVDPRHVGARDVGLPSPDRKRGSAFGVLQYGGHSLGGQEWGTEGDEYDDEDEEEDANGSMEFGDRSAGNLSTSSSSGLPLGLYHAAYDFSAESDHELDIKVGQRVRLIGHVDGGWAIVVRVREGQEDVAADEEETEKGLVPEAYLEWLGH